MSALLFLCLSNPLLHPPCFVPLSVLFPSCFLPTCVLLFSFSLLFLCLFPTLSCSVPLSVLFLSDLVRPNPPFAYLSASPLLARFVTVPFHVLYHCQSCSFPILSVLIRLLLFSICLPSLCLFTPPPLYVLSTFQFCSLPVVSQPAFCCSHFASPFFACLCVNMKPFPTRFPRQLWVSANISVFRHQH